MRISISFLLSFLLLAGCELKEELFPNCSGFVTASPETYEKGSELYYLSWVEHGTFGPKGESARRLLLMPNKKEVEFAEKIYRCQDRQVIKNMMALVLYDLSPEKYTSTATKLLTENDFEMHADLEGSWVKAGEEFEGKEVDFYFDWGGEAGLRLLKNGKFSQVGAEMLVDRVSSSYAPHHAHAVELLSMFDELPSVDLSNPPKRAEAYPYGRVRDPYWNEQIAILNKWFSENGSRISWDDGARRYKLR